MSNIQEIEPGLRSKALLPEESARGSECRRRRATVPCQRCRTPLPYIVERTKFRVMLACSRCGMQTPKPTFGSRMLKIATWVLGLAAAGIVYYAMTHQSPPQAPKELLEMSFGSPGE